MFKAYDEEGSSSSTSDSIDRMQLKIADLEARLEREAKSRIQFQNAVSLFLQHVSTSSMTPELVVILKSMVILLTRSLCCYSWLFSQCYLFGLHVLMMEMLNQTMEVLVQNMMETFSRYSYIQTLFMYRTCIEYFYKYGVSSSYIPSK